MNTPHPSRSVLSEYYFGLLPPDKTDTIRRHLASCPFCTADHLVLGDYLDTLSDTLSQATARTPQKTGIRHLIAEWIERPRLALAGSDDQPPQIYEVGAAQISLQFLSDEGHPDQVTLFGLVTGVDLTALHARVWSTSPAREVAVAAVDEVGNFLIPNLRTAQYDVMLDGPAVDILIPAVRAQG